LREEDHLILPDNDQNITLAKNAIYFIDADDAYAKTTKSKEAHKHASPLLHRLMETEPEDWNHYDLNFAVSSINFTETIGQAIDLAKKANQSIINFKRIKSTDMIEAALACNVCARILNAKFFEEYESHQLTRQFDKNLNILEHIVGYNKDLELMLLVTKIRRKIFNHDLSDIFVLCEQLIPQYDEKIGEMMRNEVEFYIEMDVFDMDA